MAQGRVPSPTFHTFSTYHNFILNSDIQDYYMKLIEICQLLLSKSQNGKKTWQKKPKVAVYRNFLFIFVT